MQIELRTWQIDDATWLAAAANDAEIAARMTDSFPHPFTEANAMAFINKAQASETSRILAIVCDGELAGAIGLHAQEGIMRKNMELGYWIARSKWGKGIATQAVKQMVNLGFSSFDITRIFARPFGSNVASQKVLEKAGFTLEARLKSTIFKDQKFEDELIYAIRKE